MSDKADIIDKVYSEFYGSVSSTLKDAKEKDPTITLQDVKDYFEKRFVRKQNLKGYNSYVADYPHQEYQLDLFFINEKDQEYNTGLLIIDIFTKFITIVKVKSKTADDILTAIKEGFRSMGKLPEMIYTDDEGSFHSKQAEAYYRENHIKHLITRGHAAYAERAIRTIKDMIYKRLDANPEAKWYDPGILSNTLVAYNYKMKSSATGMTPAEAKLDKNIFEVKTKLEMHRVKRRRYPDVKEGDEVRIYTKKKNFQKSHIPVWSINKYTVKKIDTSHGQDFYHVEGLSKAFMRHEILKLN